ncbi:MAG TPA: hypothetical protein VIL88_15700 [Devosia sp.]|uniref:hypothetical protein n=1 Tax=Devosia sp. TaxID=1871048 RepID=UPI002F91D73F
MADLESGKIASPAEAFRVAGLKRPRTRLQELKNSWSKASVAEQREFLGWLRATIPSHTPTPVSRSAPATAGVALSDAMKRDILRIMAGRAITSGQVMKEIGFKALNPSLGLALHRGTKIEPKLAAALSKWIFENVD